MLDCIREQTIYILSDQYYCIYEDINNPKIYNLPVVQRRSLPLRMLYICFVNYLIDKFVSQFVVD